MQLEVGVTVRLRKWSQDQDYFGDNEYMYKLAFKNKTFVIIDKLSYNVWRLAATPEEPELHHYAWRSKDLIPISVNLNDPNYAFRLRRK